jgi:hypothetical protein
MDELTKGEDLCTRRRTGKKEKLKKNEETKKIDREVRNQKRSKQTTTTRTHIQKHKYCKFSLALVDRRADTIRPHGQR